MVPPQLSPLPEYPGNDLKPPDNGGEAAGLTQAMPFCLALKRVFTGLVRLLFQRQQLSGLPLPGYSSPSTLSSL